MRTLTEGLKLPSFASMPHRLLPAAKEAPMRIFLPAHAVLGSALLVGQPGTAMADFRLSPGQALERLPPLHATDSPVPPAPRLDAAMRPALKASRFYVAHGFGRSVSLGFAVRQIVPPAVTVRFGTGVDPARTVDWSGGQPWNRVLTAAVRPLGLRVITGVNSVLILHQGLGVVRNEVSHPSP